MSLEITSKQILVFSCIALSFVFLFGMNLSYQTGFYEGTKVICKNLSVGINNFGEYVCYDKEKQPDSYLKNNFPEYEINYTIGGY